jgi:hypothetical protein
VDAEKAKRLLKENEDVNTFASKYPDGMNSLSKNGRPAWTGVQIGSHGGGDAPPAQVIEEQKMNALMKDASDHPNDALANAAGFRPPMAVMAYMEIARANAKKNSTVTGIALAKALELLPKIPLREQMPVITDVANLYEKLGDKENAEKTIELGTKTASEVFKQESDAADPNLAPKAYWVTTNAWRNLVDDGYKLDPGNAVTLLKEAPDDEVRAFAQISLAQRLLGGTSPALDFSMTANKDGMIMMRMMQSDGEAAK